MKITAIQKTEDSKSEKKGNAFAFSTDGYSSLTEPKKTTDAFNTETYTKSPSLSIKITGKESQKNEELSAKSTKWNAIIKLSVAQTVCGILLIIMETPLTYWRGTLDNSKVVSSPALPGFHNLNKASLAGIYALTIASGIYMTLLRKKPKPWGILLDMIHCILQWLPISTLPFIFLIDHSEVKLLMECKRLGIKTELNFENSTAFEPKVKLFGEELDFVNHSQQQFYCSSNVFTAWIVLGTCTVLTSFLALVVAVCSVYMMVSGKQWENDGSSMKEMQEKNP